MPKPENASEVPVVVVAGVSSSERTSTGDLIARELGARILWAASAHEVLDILGLVERRRGGRDTTRLVVVDAIVAEIDLGDMSALEVCDRIRQATRLRDLPFLVLSDRAEDEVLAGALAAGASDYLRRPVRPLELIARLRSALRNAQSRQRADERARRYAAVARKLQEENQELESLVCVDALTGLANRRHIEDIFRGAWQQAARSGRGLAALLVDIDGFHAYNEHHGHLEGDATLKRVAKELAVSLRRPGDLAGRWGGEEFVGLLPETDSAGARVVGERLRAAVEALGIPHGGPGWGGVVTVSIGFAAAMPGEREVAESLLGAADAALYRAKAAGRNCVAGDSDDPCTRAGVGPPIAGMPDPVVVDPSLADRLPPMIAARVEDLRGIDRAIQEFDFERLRFLARELRSLSTRHGFAIGELATKLERAASSRLARDARVAAAELRWYLEHVPVVYRRTTGKIRRT